MRHRPRILLTRVLTCISLLSVVVPLCAQEQDAPPVAAQATDAPQQISVASIESALSSLNDDSAVDASIKEMLRPKYTQAIEFVKKSQGFQELANSHRESIQTAPATTAQLREQLEKLPRIENPDSPESTGTTADLQAQLDSDKAELKLLREDLAKKTSDLADIKNRVDRITSRIPHVRVELANSQTRLDAPEFSSDSMTARRKADWVNLQATEFRLTSELEMLTQEQASQSVREGLLQAQIELLTRQVNNAADEFKALESVVLQRLTTEAKQVATASFADLPPGDEEANELANEVRALAAEFQSIIEIRKSVAAANEEINRRLGELNQEYVDIRDQLEVGGTGEIMSQLLFEIEKQLVRPTFAETNALRNISTLDEIRLAALRVDRKIRRQQEIEQPFSNRNSDAISNVLKTRVEVLGKLRTQYRNLIRSLNDLNRDNETLEETSVEVRDYISNQLFWLRTVSPVSFKTVRELPAGLAWLTAWEHWPELISAISGSVAAAPWRCIVVLLTVIVLLLARPSILSALKETGIQTRRISTDHYGLTWLALAYTILLAIPIPLLLGFVAWTMIQATDSSDWLRGIGSGLGAAAWVVLDLTFISAAVQSGGLAESHFRWKNIPWLRIRWAVLMFGVVYVPSVLLTSSTLFGSNAEYAGSAGRIAFIVSQVWTVFVVWRLFSSDEGILAQWNRTHPEHSRSQTRMFWYAVLLSVPIGLAGLSWAGYLIMAIQLSFGLAWTLWLVGLGALAYWMALRWFFIKTRRMALAEAMEKRRVRLEAAESNDTEDSDEIVTVDAGDEGVLDLGLIAKQTRHLIRLLASVGVSLAVILFWSEMIPLLDELDKTAVFANLTLLDFAKVILIAVVGGIAIKNLPGVLELSMLRQTSIDPGTRYAITRLTQYVLIAIVLATEFNVLNMDWSQFGWIAAALSVGLGFGLQEVVANFICGLIVLFERPIRVGDVVTLENITGTVTRINMRSTTITNWDRQDFVVPNKNLITGTILNWTLNESVNRLVIPVGVAYGTDTDEARQILVDIANEHPLILTEPMPMATFEEFSDSSLSIVLRAFLPDLDNRLRTITELHTEIDKRFTASGIEIPFPQRDLYIKST